MVFVHDRVAAAWNLAETFEGGGAWRRRRVVRVVCRARSGTAMNAPTSIRPHGPRTGGSPVGGSHTTNMHSTVAHRPQHHLGALGAAAVLVAAATLLVVLGVMPLPDLDASRFVPPGPPGCP
jgi:hypothetical protein